MTSRHSPSSNALVAFSRNVSRLLRQDLPTRNPCWVSYIKCRLSRWLTSSSRIVHPLNKIWQKLIQAVVRGTTNPAPCHLANASKIWRNILARRPRFPIRAAKFRAYLAYLSRFPFWAIWFFGVFDPFTQIDPKCNQVVPWSLHTFPENFMQIGPVVFS